MALEFPNSPTDGQIYVNPSTGASYKYSSTYGVWNRNDGSGDDYGAIAFSIVGSFDVPALGSYGFVEAPYNGTIESWTIVGVPTGNCVVDIWKAPYGVMPTAANTMTSNAYISLRNTATANMNRGVTQGTFSVVSFSRGDILMANLVSIDVITQVAISLKVIKGPAS